MESNPSLQCSVCGQWKRLHGVDKDGQAIQRFYSCCGEDGQHVHDTNVCTECCQRGCPYDPATVVIKYEYYSATERLSRWMWSAYQFGEVVDYHLKDMLIKWAVDRGYKYCVLKRGLPHIKTT